MIVSDGKNGLAPELFSLSFSLCLPLQTAHAFGIVFGASSARFISAQPI